MSPVLLARAYRGYNSKMASPGACLEVKREGFSGLNPVRLSDILKGLGLTNIASPTQQEPSFTVVSFPFIPQLLEAAVNACFRAVNAADKALDPVVVTEENHLIRILIPHQEPELALQVGLWLTERLSALLATTENLDSTIDASSGIEKSDLLAMSRMLSAFPTIDALVHGALLRNIPVIRYDRWPFVAKDGLEVPDTQAGVLILGLGCKQIRLAHACLTPITPELAKLLSDGYAINQHLAQARIPVPRTVPEFKNILSLTRTLQAAEATGYPVVLKARFGCSEPSWGRPANNPAELSQQFHGLAPLRRRMIVEQYVEGHPYRFLVIGQEVLAVHRISQADGGTQALQSEFLHSVLLSSVHSSLNALAIQVVNLLSLPMAEVFIVTRDIALPLAATCGAIIGIRVLGDLTPYRISGESFPCHIANKVLEQLISDPRACRIPIIAVTGTNGKTTTSRITARILQTAGYRVGLACTDGVYVNGRLIQAGDMSGISGAFLVLQQPGIDIAVLETARGGLVTRGMGFDRCEAAACTNVERDHLGQEGIETLEQMAELKRMVVESARRWVVLNGRDSRCLDMAANLTGRTICLVFPTLDPEEMADFLARGFVLVGTCLRDGNRHLSIWEGTSCTDYGDITNLPLTFGGRAEHNIENIMHAVGLTLGIGVSAASIRKALLQMMPGREETPARLNWYEKLPFSVLLDFAHNPHGLTALCRFVDKLDLHPGNRRVLVFPPRERWTEAQLQDAAEIISRSFDFIVARDRRNLEITKPGEVSRALVSSLIQLGYPSDQVVAIAEYREAISFALKKCRSGDLLVIGTWYDHEDIWLLLEEYARNRINSRKQTYSIDISKLEA